MNISIEVHASVGSDVAEIINDQCALANLLNIRVDCSLNGVKVMAQPLCDPADLYALWSKEMGRQAAIQDRLRLSRSRASGKRTDESASI